MAQVSKVLSLLQLPVAGTALLTALFYPPEGSAALLIAPMGGSAAEAIEWAQGHDAPMLGLAADGSAPIVRLSGRASALSAMADGFIPVATDLATCGEVPQNRGFGR